MSLRSFKVLWFICHHSRMILLQLGLILTFYAHEVCPFEPYLSTTDLLTKSSSSVIVTMKDTPLPQLNVPESNRARDEQAAVISHHLQEVCAKSQAPVLEMLRVLNVDAESYWISNQILIRDATPAVMQALMGFSNIKTIASEIIIPLPPLFDVAFGTRPNGTQWNVKSVKANKIWNETKGKGVLVAGIDTGVRWTHETLSENFVGLSHNGWYDPILYTQTPGDLHGHGTHTMGTIVGSNGIGVAPKAKWMACRACLASGCMQHSLLACGQYVLCPSNPTSGKNCSGSPHIVNNSWGTKGGQGWYDPVIRAWIAAGIIPFFAIGNSGPNCNTAGSPGDNANVIAVGSTDADGRLSKFSSRGPKTKSASSKEAGTKDDLLGIKSLLRTLTNVGEQKSATEIIKPDISAPGHKITSAYVTTDSSYKVFSGTSMASPAAAGVAALLLSKNQNITLSEMKELLFFTTDQQLPPTNSEQCGPIPENEFPNSMYGYGIINAKDAYKKMFKTF